MNKKSIKNFKNDLVDYLLKITDEDSNKIFDTQEKENLAISFFKKIVKNTINKKKTLIVSDYDVDGFLSGICLETYLKVIESRITNLKNEETNIELYFSKRENGYELPESEYRKLKEKYDYIIFLDTGSEYEYLKGEKNIAIIDHHPSRNIDIQHSKNILNPNKDGDVSTSTGKIVYDVIQKFEEEMKKVFGSVIKKHPALNYIKMLSSITLLSDMAKLDYENRLFLKAGIELMNDNKKNFLFLNKISDKTISAESLSFSLINIINSYSRMNNNLKDLVPLFQINIDKNGMRHSSSKKLQEEVYNNALKVHQNRKNILLELEKNVDKKMLEQNALGKNIIAINLGRSNKYTGINGLLAQHIYNKTKKPSIVVSYDEKNKIYSGSGRGYGIKKAIEKTVLEYGLDIKFGGHTMACGLKGKEEEIEALIRGLLKRDFSIDLHEKTQNENQKETYYGNISEYKKAQEDYFYLCDTVGVSKKFTCIIDNYDVVGIDTTKSGWKFVTIKDKEDFLSFYCKENMIDGLLKKEGLEFGIENTNKEVVFLNGLSNNLQKEQDNNILKGLDI